MLTIQRSIELGINTAILRPFGIWGIYEASYRLVPQIISIIRSNHPLKLTGGIQIRDYTYVKDMVEAIISVSFISNFPSGEVINLSSGTPIKLRDFIIKITKNLGVELKLVFNALPYRKTEIQHVVGATNKYDNLKLRRITKTAISDGVKAMLEEQII